MRLLRRSTGLKDVSLQMTPMIDIVFLLVIFFLCTAEVCKLELDPAVTLPVAFRASPETGDHRLVVNVGRDGGIRVMSAAYAPGELRRLIAEEAARQPAPDGGTALAVKIRADADAPYRHVSEVMAACRDAGVRRLAFGASPGEESAGSGRDLR
ncbi:MAG TPA: biopolymer transporter ExbD [Planctomycetota bacterium]|nr:biopolymer transporter ExbD [Planctomycetota bacterium]